MIKRLKVHFLFWSVILLAAFGLQAFSLLGPYKAYQVPALGYNPRGFDIGGPMTPGESYRWNVPIVTYAFDQSFIDYFGSNGIIAVEKAIKMLNDLPPASQITNDGANLYIRGEIVPTETRLINHQASVLGMLDLKSTALELLLEEMGLSEAERWTWALRARSVQTIGGVSFTNYAVIQQNYDWLTYRSTNQVNSAFYGYQVEEPLDPPVNYADAIETLISPTPSTGVSYSSVAGKNLGGGSFYFGLTRDDVAGLKFLLSANHFAVETLFPTVAPNGRLVSSPWSPVFGTNFISTNTLFSPGTNTNSTLIVQGLRGGVEKIRFQRVNFDSLLGNTFTPITNTYSDLVLSNGHVLVQKVQRAVLQPDIVFATQDLGVDNVTLFPNVSARTDTSNWQNNDLINGTSPLAGPGVVAPPVRITFSNLLPVFQNTTPDFLTDTTGTKGFVWGSFDETDAPPIIYPRYLELTLEDLQRIILGGTGQ